MFQSNKKKKEDKFIVIDSGVKEKKNKIEDKGRTGEKETKAKNKISGTRLVAFLLSFTMLAIFVTTSAIMITKSIQKKELENNLLAKEEKEKLEDHEVGVASLLSKYDANSIRINPIFYHEGEALFLNSYLEIYPIEVNYISIQGLKNETIQNKINAQIKETVFEMIHRVPNTYERLHVDANVTANFSNVLSICIALSYNEKEDTENYHLKYAYLNYRLDNGEKITFEELFVRSTPILKVIADSYYKKMAMQNRTEDMWQVDMDTIDTNDYEDQMLNITRKYQLQEQHNFYFTPKYIYLEIEGEEELLPILMEDFYPYIAIYDRYLGKGNLYMDSNVGMKGLYVFTDMLSWDFFSSYIFEEAEDNLFLDCFTMSGSDSIPSKVEQIIQNDLQLRIHKMKERAKEEPGIGTLYKEEVYYNHYEEDSYVIVDISIYKYTMRAKYYKDNIHSLIAKSNRMPRSGIGGGYYFNDDSIMTDVQNIRLQYDLDGNLITDQEENIS